MGRLDKNAKLKEHLLDNKPFRYAHLIKFERPMPLEDNWIPNQGFQVETDATRYAYLTDASFNIDFKDGSTNLAGVPNASQTYIANKVVKVGTITESTEVKINSTSLTLDATPVNIVVKKEFVYNGSAGTLLGERGSGPTLTEDIFWDDEGFREGDKISIPFGQATISSLGSTKKFWNVTGYSAANSGYDFLVSGEGVTGFCQIKNWSGGNIELNAEQELAVGTVLTLYNTYRVTKFSNNGQTMHLSILDGESPGAQTHTGTTFENVHTNVGIKVVSEEINYLLQGTMPSNYVNRQVWIYKVFMGNENSSNVPNFGTIIADPSTDADNIDGDEAVLLFKGIITGAQYKESNNRATMNWSCKSHWGDFRRVSGRLTSADYHQALDANREPDYTSTIKPEYAGDYGFWWADRAINLLARYTAEETKQRQVDINGWWAGGKRLQDYQIEVEREVDLRFDLNAKYLPTIYGVRRIKGNPVFADIGGIAEQADDVYTLEALCEGPIVGVSNIFVEDQSLICVDTNDSAARSATTDADVVCYGRMDKGEVFVGIVTTNARPDLEEAAADLAVVDKQEKPGANPYRLSVASPPSRAPKAYSPVNSVGSMGGGAVPHERAVAFTTPADMEIEFHNGVSDQDASSLLVTQANGDGFKLQKDHYDNNESTPYWGPAHRLLDTAYVARKTTLADGEETVPEVEYTVAGKLISCYNYDNSFAEDPGNTSASHTNFKLGDTINLKKTSDTSTIVANIIITDKYSYYTPFGALRYRFRWDITSAQADLVAGAGSFYMESGSNKWYMVTHNSIEAGSLTVAEIGVSAVNIAGKSTSGHLTVPLSSAPSGFSDYFTSGEDTVIQFIDTGTITSANFNNNRVKSQNVIATLSGSTIVIGSVTHSSCPDASNSTNILVTNKVTLSSGASGTNDAYNDQWLEITKARAGGNQIVLRRILDYNGSTKVVTLYEPFQSSVDMPKQGESVRVLRNVDFANSSSRGSITSVEGTDVRMSTNPAIILLDYMTDVRYGPNIALEDIDLDSFLYAAQVCDTRSDITIKLQNPTTDPVVGAKYKYTHSSNFFWQGTLSAFDTTTNEATFTNCVGKLTNRFNNWNARQSGQIVYSNDETVKTLYRMSSDATQSAVTTSAAALTSTNFGLTKVSGVGQSTLYVLLDSGNPVSYSLYDSDDCKYWAYLGWNSHEQRWATRHQCNMKIENSSSVFDNMKGILGHFNGLLTYTDGKYRLDVEVSRTTGESDTNFTNSSSDKDIKIRYITDDDIIGNVSIKDSGLDKSFNSLSANLPDPFLHFNNRSVAFFDSNYLRRDRGIVKSSNFNASGITNYFNARMMVKQKLDQSRFNRFISFDMRPVGINMTPGELIRLENSRFGWDSGKLFRISSMTLKDNCNVTVSAEEYDDSVYVINPPKTSRFDIEQQEHGAVLKVPGAPSNLQVPNNNLIGQITLSWGASAGLAPNGLYEIWRATTQGSSGNVEDHATLHDVTSVTNYTDNISSGSVVTYYYWVRSKHTMARQNTSGSSRRTYFSAFNAAINGGTSASTIGPLPGTDAKVVQLLSTDYSIVYDGAGGTPTFNPDPSDNTKVKLTATTQGYTSPQYRFLKDGSEIQAFSGASGADAISITYASTSYSSSDTKDVVEVQVREGGSGSSSASDSISIIKVKAGATAKTSHEVTLYYLQTTTNSLTTKPAVPTGAVYNFNQNLVTSNLASWSNSWPGNTYNKVVWAISATPQTSAEITSSTTDTLAASDWSNPILIDKPGDTNVVYRYYSSGTSAPGISSGYALASSRSASKPSGWYDTPAEALSNRASGHTFLWSSVGKIEEVLEDYNEAIDSVTFTFHNKQKYTWEWSTPKRLDGLDAYTVILSNEAHAFPAGSTGTVSSTTGSGTTIEVLRGGTTLTGILSGEPNADQFKVVATPTSGNETVHASSSRGASVSSGIIQYADHTGGTIMTGTSVTSGNLNYAITIGGDPIATISKRQTFTKTMAGADGTPAQNQRHPTIFRHNSNTITSTAGTFSNPLSGQTSGWQYSVPSLTANGQIIYSSTRLFTSDGLSPQESAWSTPSIALQRVDGQTITGPAGQSGRTVNLYRKGSNTRNASSGSFSNPRDNNTSWTYDVPTISANNEIVYVMTRTFTSDGNSPQDSSWSTGTVYAHRIDGTNGTSVSISSVAANTPSAGTTRVTFTNGTTMDIDDGTNGSDGDGVDVIYHNGTSNPGTPGASSGVPSGGWSFTASAPSSGQRTYISFGTRNNNTGNYTWGYPSPVTAVDGNPGQDGDDGDDGDNAWSISVSTSQVSFFEVSGQVSPGATQVDFTFTDGTTTHTKSLSCSGGATNNTLTATEVSGGASQITFSTLPSGGTNQYYTITATHSTSSLTGTVRLLYVVIKGE